MLAGAEEGSRIEGIIVFGTSQLPFYDCMMRTTRRQHLTEFGHLLLDHARQVAEEVDAVHSLREHRQAEPSGRLRVSMAPDIADTMT